MAWRTAWRATWRTAVGRCLVGSSAGVRLAVEHCVGPLSLGALIVKPGRHITAFADLPEEEAAALGPLRQASAIAGALVDANQVYNCLWSHPDGASVDIHYLSQSARVTRNLSCDYPPSGNVPAMGSSDHSVVRITSKADVGTLAGLRWSWRVGENGESGMSREGFSSAFADWVGEHQKTHKSFLVEVNDVPVGMGWLVSVDRIPSPGKWRRAAGIVQSVYVLPGHRERGHGTAVVGAIVEEAVRQGLEYLTVHPRERSASLYQRIGFRAHEGVLELDLGNQSGLAR